MLFNTVSMLSVRFIMLYIFNDSMVPGLHCRTAGRRCPGGGGLRGRRRGTDAHRAAAGAGSHGSNWDVMG